MLVRMLVWQERGNKRGCGWVRANACLLACELYQSWAWAFQQGDYKGVYMRCVCKHLPVWVQVVPVREHQYPVQSKIQLVN